jgi:hypothetical protein
VTSSACAPGELLLPNACLLLALKLSVSQRLVGNGLLSSWIAHDMTCCNPYTPDLSCPVGTNSASGFRPGI